MMSSIRIFFQKHHVTAVAISAMVFFFFDRYFKYLAYSGTVVFPEGSWFRFILFLNQGIAFSIPFPTVLFWIAAVIIFTFLLILFFYQLKREPLFSAYLFVIMLGAISNGYDRFVYHATIDYLLFFSQSAVNIADGMIIIGLAGLFLLKNTNSSDTNLHS